VPHAHRYSQKAESIAAIVVEPGPYWHVASGPMGDVPPTWAPVRTDVPRQDRRLATICPAYDSASPAERDAGARRMSRRLAMPVPLALSLSRSPDSRNTKIRRKERGHEALGCERGVWASWIDVRAPVTSRPTLSRGPKYAYRGTRNAQAEIGRGYVAARPAIATPTWVRPACHHRPGWGTRFTPHRLRPRIQARSKVAPGDERSEVTLDTETRNTPSALMCSGSILTQRKHGPRWSRVSGSAFR
jgi:hypothetical protein